MFYTVAIGCRGFACAFVGTMLVRVKTTNNGDSLAPASAAAKRAHIRISTFNINKLLEKDNSLNVIFFCGARRREKFMFTVLLVPAQRCVIIYWFIFRCAPLRPLDRSGATCKMGALRRRSRSCVLSQTAAIGRKMLSFLDPERMTMKAHPFEGFVGIPWTLLTKYVLVKDCGRNVAG